MKLVRRAINLFKATAHYVWWRPRFGRFGWRSRLGRCDLLTGSGAIHIGGRVEIRKGARLEAVGPWDGRKPKLVIGEGTIIHLYFHCGAAESVTIGRDVLIAGRVYITDHDHVFDDPEWPPRYSKRLESAPVVIEDGAWLGEGCVILKGVRVGRRAVVGANAVVTKEVPPFTVVGGVPARIIRRIDVSSQGSTE